MPLVLIPLMLGYGKPDIFHKIRDFGKSSQTQPTDYQKNIYHSLHIFLIFTIKRNYTLISYNILQPHAALFNSFNVGLKPNLQTVASANPSPP